MMDLLEKEMAKDDMPLHDHEKKLLRNGLQTGRMSNAVKIVKTALLKRDEEKASAYLEDMEPLFAPHEFWDAMPVPRMNDFNDLPDDEFNKPIEVKTLDQVQKSPYSLPTGYEWDNIDLSNDDVAKELYDLLTQNYVEDDDAMFRFDYSVDFMRWALLLPSGRPEWLICVRGGKKKKMFGCITGIPVHMTVNGTQVEMAEINFLCVHKGLRAKRLAPVLIKEITRRVNVCNIWQAIYTAGVTIPTPFTGATYWHRSLNPKKLVDVRFSHLPSGTPMARYVKFHKLPADVSNQQMRLMTDKDVPRVTYLLNQYLAKIKIHINFNEEEVAHFLLPRKGVLYSYVVETFEDKKKMVTDFYSFYALPSTILQHMDYDLLKVAYSWYNVSTTGRLEQGMKDLLIIAKQEDFDVFNCLDLMENESFMKNLKFGVGDGRLQYYMYNYRVKGIQPSDVGIVLV